LLTTKLFFVLSVLTPYSQDSTDEVGAPAKISFMTDYSLVDKTGHITKPINHCVFM
jgi:hypothetical protein